MTSPTNSARLHSAIESPYVLVSIDSARSPIDASESSDWFRYVIRHGENEIVGYRRGTEDVRSGVEMLVTQLNSRRHLKPGRVQLAIAPAKKT